MECPPLARVLRTVLVSVCTVQVCSVQDLELQGYVERDEIRE